MIITRTNNVSQYVWMRYRIARNWYILMSRHENSRLTGFPWIIFTTSNNYIKCKNTSRDSVGFLQIMHQHSCSLHVTVCDRAGSSHYYMNLLVIQLITHKLFLLLRAIITEKRVFRNVPRTFTFVQREPFLISLTTRLSTRRWLFRRDSPKH